MAELADPGLTFREGMRLPSLEVAVFTKDRVIDFPAEFPGGITFRMVGPVTITGPATGTSTGSLIYDWAVHDLDVPGTYAALFLGTDATGRPAAFPTGPNLEIVVGPMI